MKNVYKISNRYNNINSTDEFSCSQWLARQAKLVVEEKGVLSSPNPKQGHPLTSDTISKVHAFYREPDISKELPGKKDVKSVRMGDARVLKQKRLVLANLKEIYAEFKDRYPEVCIGFSKFAEHRPPECVLAGAAGTHTVCVCIIHENFKLKFLGARLDRMISIQEKQFVSYRDILTYNLCSSPNEACFLNECSIASCGDTSSLRQLVETFFDSNGIEEIEYKQWAQQERCSLQTLVSDAESFVEAFIDSVAEVRKHDFMSKEQASFFKQTRDGLHEGEVVVVADFSENYAFVYQDSVQSVHYNNNQATVHPFAAYTFKNGRIAPLNCVVVSDVLEHSTAVFHAFQNEFIAFLKQEIPDLSKIIYFSDGAGSQYKNRFNLANLFHHRDDFGISAEWHFFATAHGKGPSDGLGGTLKRLASKASLQGTTIQTAYQLYEWAAANTNMNVKFVSAAQCIDAKKDLEKRFENAVAIPGIRSKHAAVLHNKSIILKSVSSSMSSSTIKMNYTKKKSKRSTKKPTRS